ncbi:MAG: hypothetical protein VX500_05335, partial [Planctomycetota bacterium]|nr:hypothetical protein [Planctomycetota bacterium]
DKDCCGAPPYMGVSHERSLTRLEGGFLGGSWLGSVTRQDEPLTLRFGDGADSSGSFDYHVTFG